jgi:hypothetical protein
VLGRRAGKVLFVSAFSGEGGGEDTRVGWFDGRIARSGALAGGVSNEVRDVVVSKAGGVGVVASLEADEGTRVGYLAPGRRGLRDELGLATVGGRYPRGSLAFDGDALTWRTADGGSRTVPLTGEPVACTSGTTLLEHAGTRVFEVLPDRRAPRGLQADVLAACGPGERAPRELARSELHDQAHWTIRSVKRAGARAVFLAGSSGVGLFDGPVLTFTRLAPAAVFDVAVGATGPAVFAGNVDGRELVALVSGEPLATLGGGVTPGSLAVTDDGRVSWRTARGVGQSVPLAGETALTCASGTTLLDRDGVRVFERSAGDATLYGCAPGLPAPAELRRGGGWTVLELAREHGFVALYAAGRTDAVVAFGPGGVRVGTPGPSAAYAGIRDAAIAPDGRVALALRAGGRWTVTAFTPAGRERVLARPRDGVTPGSLGFDGRRVTWRSGAGAPRARSVRAT